MHNSITREEAIISAKAERSAELTRILAQLTPGSEDERSFQFIIQASVIGREKLTQAKAAGNYTIYNDWRYFDHYEPMHKTNRPQFDLVLELFRSAGVPLLDFIGIDLSNATLAWKPGSDWQHGFDARRADFTGANFENANLAGFLVNPPGHLLRWCNFRGANLSNPDPASLPQGQYCMGRLEGGEFDHCDFTGANLSRQMFNMAEMNHCDFSNANMSNAENVSGSFKGSKFDGANLRNATIVSTAFTDVVCNDKTDLTDVCIEGRLETLASSFRKRWEACNPSLGQTRPDKQRGRE